MNNIFSRRENRFAKNQSGINNHNQYYNLFMQAHVGIAIFKGPQLVIDLANDSLLKIWGKTKSVLGKPLLEALPEIKGTPYPDLLLDVYTNGITHYANENSAYLIRDGKNEQVYFNFVYQPLYEPDGTISGVMAIANEVTDQVEARKKVEESEKRFRNLVDEATVATAIYLGEDMVIQLANDAMLKLWGKEATVIGRPLLEALPELEGQPFLRLLQNVYKTGIMYSAQEDRADLIVDGRLQSFYFNFTYKALLDANGQIYGILNMAVDVTELVIAKQKLTESEEKLRIAIGIAELGTWVYVPASQTVFFDQRCKDLHGLTGPLQVNLQDILAVIEEEDRDNIIKHLEKALRPGSGGTFDAEYQVHNPQQNIHRYLRSKGKSLFLPDGTVSRVIGTLQDITELKEKSQVLEQSVQERTRQLIEANERLEKSNQELEQFAHVVSHDLKEPIRKVKFFTDRVQDEFQTLLPEKALSYLDKVKSSAARMAGMVEGVLNYSMLNSKEHYIECIDLNDIVRNIESDLELLIQQKKAVLHYNHLPQLEGARILIHQLFYNLINNSLKFSKSTTPPVIHITSKKVNDSIVPNKKKFSSYTEISIEDNGIGFDQNDADKIFKTFTRLHSRDRYEGTGMGLALCKRIVDRHHGYIYATGNENEGATFRILLPEKQ